MFCASTLISEPASPSSVAASAVNGGHSASSTPLPIGNRASSLRAKSRASPVVLCIFQWRAVEGRRASGVIEPLPAGQVLALEQLEPRAAAGRQVVHPVAEAE